jgi:hypothetical protein
VLIRFIGTIRSLFNDSPLLNDGPFGSSTGHGGGGVGPVGGAAGEPIGLLLALTKAS